MEHRILVVPPHCRCREILLHLNTLNATLTHSIGLFWTKNQPVAEASTNTIHNIRKRQTSMSPAGFEPAVPASKCPNIHALNRPATGIGCQNRWKKCLRDYSGDVCRAAEKRGCFGEVCCFHLQGGSLMTSIYYGWMMVITPEVFVLCFCDWQQRTAQRLHSIMVRVTQELAEVLILECRTKCVSAYKSSLFVEFNCGSSIIGAL